MDLLLESEKKAYAKRSMRSQMSASSIISQRLQTGLKPVTLLEREPSREEEFYQKILSWELDSTNNDFWQSRALEIILPQKNFNDAKSYFSYFACIALEESSKCLAKSVKESKHISGIISFFVTSHLLLGRQTFSEAYTPTLTNIPKEALIVMEFTVKSLHNKVCQAGSIFYLETGSKRILAAVAENTEAVEKIVNRRKQMTDDLDAQVQAMMKRQRNKNEESEYQNLEAKLEAAKSSRYLVLWMNARQANDFFSGMQCLSGPCGPCVEIHCAYLDNLLSQERIFTTCLLGPQPRFFQDLIMCDDSSIMMPPAPAGTLPNLEIELNQSQSDALLKCVTNICSETSEVQIVVGPPGAYINRNYSLI